MALPAGFVLEESSTASNLPPGFELEQPTTTKEKPGAFVSGFKSYAPQLQETYGGIKTLAGVAAERVLGAGDISKGLIASGGASMAEAQRAQEALATPERSSFTDALSKGVGSVLTDWLPFQAGSGVAQILESVAVAGAGALAGSATGPGPGTVVGMGTGLVAKEIVKRGIKESAEKILKEQGEEASKAFFEQEARKAAADVASRVGQTAALGASAGLRAAGTVSSRAVEAAEAEGKTASDIELARVIPSIATSGIAEFIGDKIGLGALSGLAKPGANYLGNITKNILLAGTKEAPVEAIQSAAERFGAKLSLTDAAAIKEYIDSAASAYAMSVAPGTVGGIRGTIQQRAGEMAPGQLPGETVEQSIARLQQEILSAQQPPAPPAAAPVDIVGMASAPGGYAELEKLKQNLLSAEPTEENKSQIADIKDVQARMNIEQVSRMTPAAQTLEEALAESVAPTAPPTALSFNDMVDVAQKGGWTDLFNYKNQIVDFVKQKTASKEVVQPELLTAIKDAQFVLDKLSSEEYQRRPAGAVYESAFAPPPPPITVVDDTTARKLGFVPSKSEKGIYNQIVNRDLTDPVQLTAVRQTLEQYVAKGTGGATTIAKVKSFLDTIPQGVKDVGTPVTTPSGAGPTVVSEPGAGAAPAGVGVTEPSGVVPTEQDVGVADVGEGRPPVAVAPPIAPVPEVTAPVTELIAPVTPITSAPIAPVAEVSAPVASIAPPPSQEQVPQSDLSGTAVGGAPDVVPFTTKPPGVGPAITEQQDYEQAIVQANKAARAVERKSKSLWGRLRGVLPMQDVNDISPDRKFRMLGNVRQGMSLSTLVADGAVDEFLPPDMRHDVDTFDEYDSTEYIKDRLREGSYLTFDAQAEIRQIGSTIAELEDALDAHLKEKEVNDLIQEAIDEQEGTVSEAEATEPSDEAAVAGTVPTEQAAPAVTEEPAAPVQFKIVKTEVSDDAGGSKTAWNVTDKADGYIFDTFDTRKEAQDHVNRNKAPKKSLAGVSEKRLQELDRRAKAARKAPAKAPEVVTQQTSPEVQAKIKQLEGLLKKLMSRFGLQDVGLNLVDDLAANGEYSNNLIKLAIDAINPVRDIRHESLHALKELGFFTDQQWSVLEKKAKDTWINEFLKQRNINGEPLQTGEKSRYDAYVEMFNSQGQTQEYIDEALIEEAISDAFGSFDVNKAPSGMIQAVLKRMKTFFSVIKEALGQSKIETAEDIFEKAEAGKLKGTAKPEAKEAKASLRAPQTEAFKRWFGDSKVVDENGEPLVVYHKSYDDFTEFSSEKIGSNDYGYAGRGFYFMDIPLQGLTYGDRTMPVYLSLQNPYIRTAKNWKTDKLNPYSWIADNLDKYGSRAQASEAWTQMMKDKGYDGFIDRADSSGGELVAFYPTQIKSAIGNIGAYSLTNPDIRKSLRAPDTRAFKQWFGNSKIVNDDGTPKVMYHGTAKDYGVIGTGRRQARAIFLTDEPSFAEKFSKDTFARAASKAEEILSPEQIKQGRADAVAAIRKDYRSRPEGKEMIESIKGGYDNATAEAQEYLRNAYKNYLPAGPNIMPLFVRAENPFDYQNKNHAEMVADLAIKNEGWDDSDRAGLVKGLTAGNWDVIEEDYVQKAIKALGFDSFYVTEDGKKSLAVYESNQLKSATGNIGTYDITSPDIRYSLRDTALTDKRINRLINEYGYTDGRTFGIAAYVNPEKFVNATTPDKADADRIKQEAGTLDRAKIAEEGQTPYLQWDIDRGVIVGHEGRHRMAALAAEGIQSAPVVLYVKDRNGYKKPDQYKRQGSVTMLGQKFQDGRGQPLTVTKLIPLEYRNTEALKEEFGGEAKIKYSLRARATPSMMKAIERVTTARDELTFVERITKAIAPDTFSKFRAQALNRYNQLSVYDKMVAKKMGGIQLMADRSAESAALMSDLGAGVVAAAMGVHDRVGGIPVYKNGFTTISTQKGTVKGVIAIFAPLAKYNDPDIYRAFQFWAGSKRGSRFLANGTEHLYTQADLQEANKVLAMYPEFTQIFKEWTKYNEGLVQYMVDTGVISAANGKHFIAHSDYLPFYRQIDGENTVGPNIFQSISGVKAPRKIKGGEAPLADFLETIVRNTQASIQAGLKNVAAQRAVNQAVAIGEASRLPTVASGLSVVTILENGLKVSYDCNDPLFIDAVKSLNLPDLPFLGILAGPANLLRNLVTKDPGFMLVNLMRDSMSAYVTSGVKMVPIVATAKNFATALAGKSPEYMALLNAGVLGGYDYSAGVEASANQLAKELRKSAGVETKAEKLMKPATWLWEALEKGTQASDAATRIEVYKKTLAETNNEAEALFRSLEVMNFNRKGSSAVIRIATAAIPFLNARMQGLDILYRSGISPRFDKNATTREKAIQKTFFVRGATIAALSCMYWMLTHDDEEYEKQEQETKDNFWLFPSLGIKIAIPFEVGIIFKVIPERIMAYSFGNDTGKDFMASMKRNLQNTMPITLTGMIPQVAKPYLESQMNYSLFTNRAIISQGMENVAPEFQALPATGTIFKDLGEQLGVSPIKLEYMWKGYTGTMGTYLADAIDSVYNLHKDAPKAAKRFEQLPVIKRFAVDPDARGSVTAFYDLKNATDTVVKTSNLLERSQNPEAYAKYVQENVGILASKDYVQEVYNTLMEFSGYKEMIRNTEMDPKEKRDLLLSITRIENHLTSNVQTVRKAAGL